MRKIIKTWLVKRYLADELAELQVQKVALEAEKRSLDIVAIAREQLGGINPRLINKKNTVKGIPDKVWSTLGGEIEQEVFIKNVHGTLYNNPSLKVIIDYLTQKQVIHAITRASDMAEVNFARATINGLALLADQINDIEAEYKNRFHLDQEPYDQFKVL